MWIFVATISTLILASVVLGFVLYKEIEPWFFRLPSDEIVIEGKQGHRGVQVWYQRYLSPQATVIHINPSLSSIYNVQKLLKTPAKHVVLHSDLDEVVRITHFKSKHGLLCEVIHGELAETALPSDVIWTNYAERDYLGIARDVPSTIRGHTLKQLQSLYNITFDTVLFETEWSSSALWDEVCDQPNITLITRDRREALRVPTNLKVVATNKKYIMYVRELNKGGNVTSKEP